MVSYGQITNLQHHYSSTHGSFLVSIDASRAWLHDRKGPCKRSLPCRSECSCFTWPAPSDRGVTLNHGEIGRRVHARSTQHPYCTYISGCSTSTVVTTHSYPHSHAVRAMYSVVVAEYICEYFCIDIHSSRPGYDCDMMRLLVGIDHHSHRRIDRDHRVLLHAGCADCHADILTFLSNALWITTSSDWSNITSDESLHLTKSYD